jgi:hypothetical protein
MLHALEIGPDPLAAVKRSAVADHKGRVFREKGGDSRCIWENRPHSAGHVGGVFDSHGTHGVLLAHA